MGAPPWEFFLKKLADPWLPGVGGVCLTNAKTKWRQPSRMATAGHTPSVERLPPRARPSVHSSHSAWPRALLPPHAHAPGRPNLVTCPVCPQTALNILGTRGRRTEAPNLQVLPAPVFPVSARSVSLPRNRAAAVANIGSPYLFVHTYMHGTACGSSVHLGNHLGIAGVENGPWRLRTLPVSFKFKTLNPGREKPTISPRQRCRSSHRRTTSAPKPTLKHRHALPRRRKPLESRRATPIDQSVGRASGNTGLPAPTRRQPQRYMHPSSTSAIGVPYLT